MQAHTVPSYLEEVIGLLDGYLFHERSASIWSFFDSLMLRQPKDETGEAAKQPASLPRREDGNDNRNNPQSQNRLADDQRKFIALLRYRDILTQDLLNTTSYLAGFLAFIVVNPPTCETKEDGTTKICPSATINWSYALLFLSFMFFVTTATLASLGVFTGLINIPRGSHKPMAWNLHVMAALRGWGVTFFAGGLLLRLWASALPDWSKYALSVGSGCLLVMVCGFTYVLGVAEPKNTALRIDVPASEEHRREWHANHIGGSDKLGAKAGIKSQMSADASDSVFMNSYSQSSYNRRHTHIF